MSEGYKALYRKYRPMTFDDVHGQEHIVPILKNQISFLRNERNGKNNVRKDICTCSKLRKST